MTDKGHMTTKPHKLHSFFLSSLHSQGSTSSLAIFPPNIISMMLLKVVVVLLSSALQPNFLAVASPTSLRQNDEEDAIKIEPSFEAPHLPSGYMRRMKKDKVKKKDNDDEEEAISSGELESTSVEEDTVEELTDAEEASSTPQLRSSISLNADSSGWNRGSYAVSSEHSKSIKIYAPELARAGDTLFLFLSITDGQLPLRIGGGWTRGAECFKSYNRQDECLRAAHCVQRDGPYCLKFRRGDEVGDGKDLATVLFYRQLTEDDPGCWTIEFPKSSITWAVVTAITNVNEDKPIFRADGRSCDVAWESKFPSIKGQQNDVLLLSQCFDDTADRQDFLPPDGTERLGWTSSFDEAGFLFGKKLDNTGQTGELVTRGPGGPKCKDALLSVVVNRN